MKILLVEDQDLERGRTQELLETNGFVIDEARSAEEALDRFTPANREAGHPASAPEMTVSASTGTPCRSTNGLGTASVSHPSRQGTRRAGVRPIDVHR